MKEISQSSPYHYPENVYDTFILGVVTDYSPATYTCDVKLHNGPHIQSIPVLGVYGPQFGTDISTPTKLRGATVILLRVYNQLYVLSPVPSQMKTGFKVSESTTPAGYGGSNEHTYGQPVDRDFSSLRSKEYMPGDRIDRVDGGAESGLLQEGVAYLKVSSLCQFILCKFRDLGRLVSRVFQHFTDFGEVHFTHNDQGRVGVHVKGGADFLNETHPSKAKWTVQAWIGDHPGDETDRLHIRVNDPGDSEFVEFTFNTLGEVFMETTGKKTLKVGKDHIENVDGDRKTTVIGNETVTILDGKTDTIPATYNIACSALNITKI